MKRGILIAFLIIAILYISLAFNETSRKSSPTLNEAFIELLYAENIEYENITDQVVKLNDDYAIILFQIDNRVPIALFEKGFLGWKYLSYNTGTKAIGFSGTSQLIRGWIPDDISTATEKVLVNGNSAYILDLNKGNKIWAITNFENKLDINNISVQFLDVNDIEIGSILIEF